MATAGRSRPTQYTGEHELDLDIEAMSLDGDGVARVGGQPIHIPFTIPGERVRARVRGRFGTLLSVLRASPHRVTPKCAHFGPDARQAKAPVGSAKPSSGASTGIPGPPCGGCSWQHIAYPEQLRLKTALLDRLVKARIATAPPALPMRAASPDNPWGFRQKVHFVFGEGAGRRGSRDLLMGHYARASRRIVSVHECPVHDSRGNQLAFDLHRQLARARIQADAGQGAALQSVTVRAAVTTSELMATLVISHESDRSLRTATRKVMDAAAPGTSFHLNLHDRDDGLIFGTRTRKLAGPDRLRDEVGATSYLISPTAFFQTNVAAAGLLVSAVLDAMPAAPGRVLDLYAGAGLFAIPLGRAGHSVLAVESNRQAVADGIASARLNRIGEEHCRFMVARTEEALASASRVDVVVLDPPREGCAPGVIDRLFGGVRPARAIYVSCNPEALAGDLKTIVDHGYRIQSLLPIDMFPHTPHIETVAVLSR